MHLKIDYEEIVERALDVLFPGLNDRKNAADELQAYGTESYHREIPRVRLAILYLASKEPNKFSFFVDAACDDFRDLLCWAEYPHSSHKWNLKETNPKKYQKLQAKEQKEYLDWISSIQNERS